MKAQNAKFCALPDIAPDCAIVSSIGFQGQKRIKNNSPLGSHLTAWSTRESTDPFQQFLRKKNESSEPI
jgi:hypothetical protein